MRAELDSMREGESLYSYHVTLRVTGKVRRPYDRNFGDLWVRDDSLMMGATFLADTNRAKQVQIR
ncbi:MAG TPA: hypothetical protein VHO02_02075 [Fibrobacteria bacterium]|nr:hypothetical protein [Fibrobacteria bacterium]